MNYKEKYEQALERAKILVEKLESTHIKGLIYHIFPELKENEDERIRKGLIKAVSGVLKGNTLYATDVTREEALAWLEKQGTPNAFEVPETSIKDVEEVTSRMQHIEDDMRPIAEFIINYANWNLHKDEWNQPTLTVPLFRVLDALIQRGKPYGECVQNIKEQGQFDNNIITRDDEMLQAISVGLTDVVEDAGWSDFGGIPIEEIQDWLEKQGENKPTDKTAPKFKVGDWITDGQLICKVLSVTGNSYELHLHNDDYCHFETDIQSVNKYYHLWAIQDAKDGDVLTTDNFIFIFKSIDNNNGVHYYCHYEISKHEDDSPRFGIALSQSLMGIVGGSFTHYRPATKEQCDLLFSKMKEAGCEWDSERKELKKIEPKKLDVWNAGDEQNLNVALSFIPDECLRRWLKDKLCYDTLDADKVIAWLVANICDFEYYVKLFKKDFGL